MRQKYPGFWKMPSGSPVVRTVAGMVGGNFLAMALGLVGTLVQARFIAPGDLGYFRQFSIFAAYAFFLHLGLLDALQRLYPLYIGQERQEEALAVAEICQSWTVVLASLVSGVFAVLALVAFVEGNWRAALAWLVQAASFTGFTYGAYLSATYRSGHDFVTVAKSSVIANLASLFALPCFLFFPYLALVLRSVVSSTVSLIYLHRHRPLHLHWRFSWKDSYGVARQGIWLFTAGYGLATGWGAMEITLVVKLLGTTCLGLWTISTSVLEMANKAAQAISAVYLPRVVEEYGRTGSIRAGLRMCRRPMLWGIVPVALMGLGVCVVLPFLVPWLMPKYMAAIPTMCLMMLYLPLIILELPYHLVVAKGHWIWMNVFSYTGLGCFALLALLAVRLGLGLNGVVGASLLGRTMRLGMIYVFVAVEVRRERQMVGISK